MDFFFIKRENMKMAADGSQISLTRRNKPGTKAKVRKNPYFVHLNANKLHLCYEWWRNFPPFAVDFTLIVQFSAWGVCIVNSFFQLQFPNRIVLRVITSPLQDYCRWPDEPFEEMDSTLAVQQYIQQLIKNDPSNIDLILTNPETHDEGVWKYEHLRFNLCIS